VKERKAAILGAALIAMAALAHAEQEAAPVTIDLATALRLAGAQSLEIQIAQAQLDEAEANRRVARARFFPWLSPNVGYRRHEGKIQDVVGNMIETDKQSYAPGVALNEQVDVGDTLYRSLAARQLVTAAQSVLDSRRQDALFAAAAGYFDLARAQAAVSVAEEAVRISLDYAGQVQRAVEIGIAFKGDAQRAQVQVERNRMLLRAAQEQQRVAAARLAQALRLEPATPLVAQETELQPLPPATGADAATLVQRALGGRSELKQFQALAASAREITRGVREGAWLPTVTAQAQWGGLGGGKGGAWGNFGQARDYVLGVSWRIGPGGLFDHDRVKAAEAREQASGLQLQRTRDEVARQVVEAHARAQSLADQLEMVRRALQAAEETLRLSRERREFGVGAVLETIQAEQELTRARLDYLAIVVENNKAQFALKRALGDTSVSP
jgi:outer membrane protein TolC